MTVCPKCKGYGIVGSAVPDILRGRGAIFSSNECDMCHGSGEVPMTNEEWLRSLNTEQLAEFLNLIIRVGPYENEPKDFWEHVYGRGGEHGAKSIVEWLKQPHNS